MCTMEEAQARIAALEAELAKEKAKSNKEITLKVSEKGCVQINGIRKFPFAFYQDEILKILDMENEIKTFIDSNQDRLSKKK